ncbi:hypothetical protein F5Y19DRAFT_476837 [Xylariaceae sp. FL1651]|nr:hypothetical protein F5Y19DRAFT_476837 [Xylariaceae sp. FL1651]
MDKELKTKIRTMLSWSGLSAKTGNDSSQNSIQQISIDNLPHNLYRQDEEPRNNLKASSVKSIGGLITEITADRDVYTSQVKAGIWCTTQIPAEINTREEPLDRTEESKAY